MSRPDLNRRQFMGRSLAAAGVGASFAIGGTKSSGRVLGANETIRVAVAGLNGRGSAHVGAFAPMADVQIAYLVDPDTKTYADRLKQVDFQASERRVEYIGRNSMWGPEVIPNPDEEDLTEIVVRFAARCPTIEDARKVFTESVPLYNNGPAGASGIGTRPPIKELFCIWPCMIPRELITIKTSIVEVQQP